MENIKSKNFPGAGWYVMRNNKDYCLYSDGAMICNTTAYGYKFDSSGVATKLS